MTLEDKPETKVDPESDPAPGTGTSKSAKKRRARKGISGKTLPEVPSDSPFNNDVDDLPPIPNRSTDSSANKPGDKKKPGPKPKEEISKFFGVYPTQTEVDTVKEVMSIAQQMVFGIPPFLMTMQPDPTTGVPVPTPRSLNIGDMKTTVFEYDQELLKEKKKVLIRREVTYNYAVAKCISITSGGMVGKMEDFCENNPVKASIGLGVFNVYMMAKEAQKLKMVLEAEAKKQQQKEQRRVPVDEPSVVDAREVV